MVGITFMVFITFMGDTPSVLTSEGFQDKCYFKGEVLYILFYYKEVEGQKLPRHIPSNSGTHLNV